MVTPALAPLSSWLLLEETDGGAVVTVVGVGSCLFFLQHSFTVVVTATSGHLGCWTENTRNCVCLISFFASSGQTIVNPVGYSYLSCAQFYYGERNDVAILMCFLSIQFGYYGRNNVWSWRAFFLSNSITTGDEICLFRSWSWRAFFPSNSITTGDEYVHFDLFGFGKVWLYFLLLSGESTIILSVSLIVWHVFSCAFVRKSYSGGTNCLACLFMYDYTRTKYRCRSYSNCRTVFPSHLILKF